jgi:hypothetical protein
MTINGKAIAMTVAGLLLAVGPRVGQADEKKSDKIKCSGINSCKGKGACSGAANGCAGKNGCKGKGWVEASEKECKDKGGTVVADKDAKDKAPAKK